SASWPERTYPSGWRDQPGAKFLGAPFQDSMPAWNVSVNSTAARFEMAPRTQSNGRFAVPVRGAGFTRAGSTPTAAVSSWLSTAVFFIVHAALAPNHKLKATN